MRPILALALMLLVLTLALNHSRAWSGGARENGALADRALEIVVGAKGVLLPQARIGSGPERIGEAMRLGERTLLGTGCRGLRAAFLGADFALREERCFDVALSAGAGELLAAVEDADEGTILVLASSGRLEREDGPAPSQELERALARLGARAELGRTTPESWALLALRLEQGWVPLAESYSTESGVALAFVLAPDLERYADFQGDFARVRADEQRELFLEDELAHASLRTSGVELARERSVGGRRLAGLLVPPAQDGAGNLEPGRVVWNEVALEAGSGLVVWLGLADGASVESDGVAFEVRVDGELVERKLVLPGAPWKPWQVDLRPFAGRKATLELLVDPLHGVAGDAALWGRPVLVHGYERAPIQVWMDEPR